VAVFLLIRHNGAGMPLARWYPFIRWPYKLGFNAGRAMLLMAKLQHLGILAVGFGAGQRDWFTIVACRLTLEVPENLWRRFSGL